jgi:protein-tyrosine phosphatase
MMAIGSSRPAHPLVFEGLMNVRDLGGHGGRAGQVVRWNRLLRADDLGRATAADLATLLQVGVRTVVDLRTDRERAASRPPVFRGAHVEIHHLPMVRLSWEEANRFATCRDRVDDGETEAMLAQRSLDMLVEGAPAIADALRILAQPGALPAVIHSSLGKDRAGLLAAVILAVVGVPTGTIAQDYALSAPAVAAAASWSRHDAVVGGSDRWDPPAPALAAPPGAMVRVLDRVHEQCGSMVGFARGIGVEFDVIEALHRELLG